MKHKHADFIKAWADGETVQFMSANYGWLDVPDTCHSWLHDEYRIKPKTIRYRVALMSSAHGEYLAFALDATKEKNIRDNSNFDRWLSDWVEA